MYSALSQQKGLYCAPCTQHYPLVFGGPPAPKTRAKIASYLCLPSRETKSSGFLLGQDIFHRGNTNKPLPSRALVGCGSLSLQCHHCLVVPWDLGKQHLSLSSSFLILPLPLPTIPCLFSRPLPLLTICSKPVPFSLQRLESLRVSEPRAQ